MEAIKFKEISKKQCFEVILIAIAVLSVLSLYFKSLLFLPYILGLTITGVLFPVLIKPVAWLWFFFGHILGAINSRILLTILFFLVVTPISILRNIFSFTGMTNWKKLKSLDTTFITRNKSFDADDFDKTF